ncbi:MAG: helix-turn-helix domain-containing protein [Verrucomicrobia bacterium]|nr:helix-turn-helix domain-containing protein [Verrucomicrobiota bacterium]
MNKDAYLIQRLDRSDLYKEFKHAFRVGTGLPLTLRAVNFWDLAHRGQPYENPFCALIAQTNRGCAACLETEQRAVDAAKDRPATVRCFAGLCHTAVPIKLGDRTIGFLQTGQVALELPSPAGFEAITRQLTDWGVAVDLSRLQAAYYHSRVLSPNQYSGLIQLLEIFAQQLCLAANQVVIQDAEAEPPMIRRAKAYIAGHYGDPIGLDDIACAMHVSTYYFCKMFRKTTGLTFTDHLGRIRVEKAKNLLLNPHLRVSEIAYTVGFQSLTHFNRLFRQLTGESPTQFRDRATRRTKGTARNLSVRSLAPEGPAAGALRLAA